MTSSGALHPTVQNLLKHKTHLGVIGLGYVGLPLAVSFSKKFSVIGFDVSEKKVQDLKSGLDTTGEIENLDDLRSPNIAFTADAQALSTCGALIVAVPTPVDVGNKPDLSMLLAACKSIGAALATARDDNADDTTPKEPTYICFESTVYPGCTMGECLAAIERASDSEHGVDFLLGYSPERINPGDRAHRFESIQKIVSGSTAEALDFFSELYAQVVTAGVYKASSIPVAEAAKVIENTQRDLNIALINELAMIFSRLGLDTTEVLAAAGTKWNFLKFEPGLVGGHCIGVDPYYLTYKAESVGYIPRVILSGRSVNDSMGAFIANEAIKRTLAYPPKGANAKYQALVLGFTFKENVPDIRNTKVIDVVRTLEEFKFQVDIVDPVANPAEAQHEYEATIHRSIIKPLAEYDLLILAVKHDEFQNILSHWLADELAPAPEEAQARTNRLTIVDIKGLIAKAEVNRLKSLQGIDYWRV